MQHDRMETVSAAIIELMTKNKNVVIAIDGRCAAGKTTLAQRLSQRFDCNVIHMDDFFLRPEQRTEQRLQIPGENADHERFVQEVLCPLGEGRAFRYRPFDCHTQSMGPEICFQPKALTVIEGSYCCHPLLRERYDLRIFLSVDPQEQLCRIRARNAESEQAFRDQWIPLEERYFSFCRVAECCELNFE